MGKLARPPSRSEHVELDLRLLDGRVEVASTLLVRVALRAHWSLKEQLLVTVLLLTPSDRASLEDSSRKRVEDDRRALAALVR